MHNRGMWLGVRDVEGQSVEPLPESRCKHLENLSNDEWEVKT